MINFLFDQNLTAVFNGDQPNLSLIYLFLVATVARPLPDILFEHEAREAGAADRAAGCRGHGAPSLLPAQLPLLPTSSRHAGSCDQPRAARSCDQRSANHGGDGCAAAQLLRRCESGISRELISVSMVEFSVRDGLLGK